MEVRFKLNGKQVSAEVSGDTILLDVLRNLGCYSVKCGCETTNCGLCTVWINGKVIQKGVNSWAKAFLAVNSDAQDKEITDQSLYQSIANTEHRRLLKEERDAFYKESVVNINEVSTQVKSAKKAQYGKTDVGVVECDIDVKGTRNDQAFEKIYTMQMVVNYQTNVVSVYEVEDITWE